jgi:Ca2+-binding EF-hand superfamily protein
LLDLELDSLLDLLYQKVSERFIQMSAAFKFFDQDNSLSINFIEFYSALDRIRMKVTEGQARKMFDYLDKNRSGDLTYNEFCEICEERRRKIDNF